jgi:hypothetical protein
MYPVRSGIGCVISAISEKPVKNLPKIAVTPTMTVDVSVQYLE